MLRSGFINFLVTEALIKFLDMDCRCFNENIKRSDQRKDTMFKMKTPVWIRSCALNFVLNVG